MTIGAPAALQPCAAFKGKAVSVMGRSAFTSLNCAGKVAHRLRCCAPEPSVDTAGKFPPSPQRGDALQDVTDRRRALGGSHSPHSAAAAPGASMLRSAVPVLPRAHGSPAEHSCAVP